MIDQDIIDSIYTDLSQKVSAPNLLSVKKTKAGTFCYLDSDQTILHCENGPAITWINGSQEWYVNGARHRNNAPAVVFAFGGEKWYRNNQLHNPNGPAIVDALGNKLYYLYDVQIPEWLWNMSEIYTYSEHRKLFNQLRNHEITQSVYQNSLIELYQNDKTDYSSFTDVARAIFNYTCLGTTSAIKMDKDLIQGCKELLKPSIEAYKDATKQNEIIFSFNKLYNAFKKSLIPSSFSFHQLLLVQFINLSISFGEFENDLGGRMSPDFFKALESSMAQLRSIFQKFQSGNATPAETTSVIKSACEALAEVSTTDQEFLLIDQLENGCNQYLWELIFSDIPSIKAHLNSSQTYEAIEYAFSEGEDPIEIIDLLSQWIAEELETKLSVWKIHQHLVDTQSFKFKILRRALFIIEQHLLKDELLSQGVLSHLIDQMIDAESKSNSEGISYVDTFPLELLAEFEDSEAGRLKTLYARHNDFYANIFSQKLEPSAFVKFLEEKYERESYLDSVIYDYILDKNHIESNFDYLTKPIEVDLGETIAYMFDGVFHREDGEPAIIFKDGSKNEWWVKGVRHREGAPAIECSDGTQYWYNCGNLHRTDGPAVTQVSEHGEVYRWYLNNVEHTKEEWQAKVSKTQEKKEIKSVEDAGVSFAPASPGSGLTVSEGKNTIHLNAEGFKHSLTKPAVEGEITEYWIDGVKLDFADWEYIIKNPEHATMQAFDLRIYDLFEALDDEGPYANRAKIEKELRELLVRLTQKGLWIHCDGYAAELINEYFPDIPFAYVEDNVTNFVYQNMHEDYNVLDVLSGAVKIDGFDEWIVSFKKNIATEASEILNTDVPSSIIESMLKPGAKEEMIQTIVQSLKENIPTTSSDSTPVAGIKTIKSNLFTSYYKKEAIPKRAIADTLADCEGIVLEIENEVAEFLAKEAPKTPFVYQNGNRRVYRVGEQILYDYGDFHCYYDNGKLSNVTEIFAEQFDLPEDLIFNINEQIETLVDEEKWEAVNTLLDIFILADFVLEISRDTATKIRNKFKEKPFLIRDFKHNDYDCSLIRGSCRLDVNKTNKNTFYIDGVYSEVTKEFASAFLVSMNLDFIDWDLEKISTAIDPMSYLESVREEMVKAKRQDFNNQNCAKIVEGISKVDASIAALKGISDKLKDSTYISRKLLGAMNGGMPSEQAVAGLKLALDEARRLSAVGTPLPLTIAEAKFLAQQADFDFHCLNGGTIFQYLGAKVSSRSFESTFHFFKDGKIVSETLYSPADLTSSIEYYSDPECTKLHALSRPARVTSDGAEEWYQNGEKHRDNGPAYVKGETKFWLNHGKLHRLNGPSVEGPNNYKEYHINGQRYENEYEFMLAVARLKLIESFKSQVNDQSLDFSNPQVVKSGIFTKYMVGNYLHRTDGPARVCDTYSEWYYLNKRHRDGGPAWYDNIGNFEYWNNGNCHRLDGPAVVHGDRKKWYQNNLLHRLDGPAVEDIDHEEYWVNGQLHREYFPAIIANGNKEWWLNGNRHNPFGPAIINSGGGEEYFLDGVKLTEKEWKEKGGEHLVVFNKGNVLEFKFDEQVHRKNGPAIIFVQNGEIEERYFFRGRLHRLEGPAHSLKLPLYGSRTNIEERAWYQFGVLHQSDGPAVIHTDSNGIYRTEYWLDGVPFDTKEAWEAAPRTYARIENEGQPDERICFYKNPDFTILHREGDLPAVEYIRGTKKWYKNGLLHRDNDQPATVYSEDTMDWYQNGERHRDNGPASITRDKTQYYFQHGQLHRVDGPSVIYENGDTTWHQNDQLHRLDGPAIDHENSKEYWVNGKLNRTDGPAIEQTQPDGSIKIQYFIEGQELTEAEFKLRTHKPSLLEKTFYRAVGEKISNLTSNQLFNSAAGLATGSILGTSKNAQVSSLAKEIRVASLAKGGSSLLKTKEAQVLKPELPDEIIQEQVILEEVILTNSR